MRLQDVILRGTRASQPAATAVSAGTVYYVTDENVTERSNGATWDDITDGSALPVRKRAFFFTFDGGGEAITTDKKVRIPALATGTLTGWRILADTSGAIKFDVWKDVHANYPPTDDDSITNGHEPEITASGDTAEDTDLSDWTSVAVTEGDDLIANVDSCTDITWAILVLYMEVTG